MGSHLRIPSTVFYLSLLRSLVSPYSFVPTSSHRTVLSIPSQSPIHVDPSSQQSQQTTHHPPNNQLTMKVSRGSSKGSKQSSLETINRTRRHIAGKRGTKHYMDPNKVFIGNLPYDATVEDLTEFLRENLLNLHSVLSVKIITDWKTGKSKGYGFVQFMDPMAATVAMNIVKGKKLKGRVIRLDQGRKKDDLENRALFVKKRAKNKRSLDLEEVVIDEALDQAEGVLRGETKGKSGGVQEQQEEEEDVYSLDDFEDIDDSLFDEDDEEYDDEDEVDGIFEQIYGTNKYEELDDEEAKNMNRAQKREAARRKPRKKLPHKGFEAIPKRNV